MASLTVSDIRPLKELYARVAIRGVNGNLTAQATPALEGFGQI